MLLGINKVVNSRDVSVGNFYIRQNYGEYPVIFMAAGLLEDTVWEIIFDPNENVSVFAQEFSDYGPVAELQDVHVRVDAASLEHTSRTHHIRPPMLVVDGEQAYVCASMGWRGSKVINLSNGTVVKGRLENWVSFSRWQLVMDDGGEEIPIASFGVPSE